MSTGIASILHPPKTWRVVTTNHGLCYLLKGPTALVLVGGDEDVRTQLDIPPHLHVHQGEWMGATIEHDEEDKEQASRGGGGGSDEVQAHDGGDSEAYHGGDSYTEDTSDGGGWYDAEQDSEYEVAGLERGRQGSLSAYPKFAYIASKGEDKGERKYRTKKNCTECRRRKIKCDRVFPCGPCVTRNERERCEEYQGRPAGYIGYTHLSDFDLLVRRSAEMEGVIKELKLSVEQLQTQVATRIDTTSP